MGEGDKAAKEGRQRPGQTATTYREPHSTQSSPPARNPEGAEPRTFKILAPHTEAKEDNLDNQVHNKGKPFQSPSCFQLWPMTALPTTLVSRTAALVKEWELSSGLRVQSSWQRSLNFPWGHLSYPVWCRQQQKQEPCSFQMAAAVDFPTQHQTGKSCKKMNRLRAKT